MSKKIILILGILISCGLTSFDYLSAQDNVIKVYFQRETGRVNKNVFGNNFIGYDPMTYEDWEYCGYYNYGDGIWDPVKKIPVQEVIDLAKEAGISIIRFPGGCGTHHYNWKDSIGEKRKRFLYGLDEFLRTCTRIGAEPVVTVSYFTGDEQDAADLVEYLNYPTVNKNHNGSIDWAVEREHNGHGLPYKVKYFEIGNEVYHGDHREIRQVYPEEYAKKYLKYYEKMKKIDPSIKIGAILHTPDWNKKILKIIGHRLDFGITHIYLSGGFQEREIEKKKPETIFKKALAEPDLYLKTNLKEELSLLKELCGRDIPLAITEFNGGFMQERPVPYRHCLGTALLNAELLRIFMKPEHKILMANYWNFVNEYWGMIANDFDGTGRTLYNKYYKRPNYYVFELYKKYFDERLIETEVKSESYKLENIDIPYLSVNASKSFDGNRLCLIVINRKMENSIKTTIELKRFKPLLKANVAILNGPSVDATNEIKHDNVKIREFKFSLDGDSFQFTFEPHSLTAIELVSKQEEK